MLTELLFTLAWWLRKPMLWLVRYRVVVPTVAHLRAIGDRLDAAGVRAESRDGGLEVTDPSGNRALLEAERD